MAVRVTVRGTPCLGINGGQERARGWYRDAWDRSWPTTPVALARAITDPDRQAARRAFEAMTTVGRIDIAAISGSVAPCLPRSHINAFWLSA